MKQSKYPVIQKLPQILLLTLAFCGIYILIATTIGKMDFPVVFGLLLGILSGLGHLFLLNFMLGRIIQSHASSPKMMTVAGYLIRTAAAAAVLLFAWILDEVDFMSAAVSFLFPVIAMSIMFSGKNKS